jgi:proton-dependent oligopeptide transporter, POT family
MAKDKPKKEKKKKLPREFWSVNFSNLFERGAYYGMTAVAAYHFNTNLGIPSWIVGIYLTISMVMINFLPLISTALASKYGFKKILLASYTTLFIGYIFLGLGNTIILVGLAYVVMGFGSGFEKALIAASISHSSDEDNRVFAFNVYYWIINTGAFIVPLSITFLFAPVNFGTVFFLMALFIACSFTIILTSYKNPIEPDPSVPAFKAVKGLKVIFKDPKFAIVLLLFAGCWFMLYTRMALFPMYIPHFGILEASWIGAIAALNPLTIILVSPIWSGIIKKRNIEPLKLLITGILFVSLGFLIVGFTLNPAILISGIVILSFGELVSYPAFLTYVSKIPPKEKRSIYMGYSFLPLAIAGATGPAIGGALYYHFSEGMHMGAIVWSIIACVGLVSASGFMHYDRIFNHKKKRKTKSKSFLKFRGSGLGSKITATIPILFIPIILILASTVVYEPAKEEEPGSEIIWVHEVKNYSFSGTLKEEAVFTKDLTLLDDANITNIDLDLTWSTKPDIRRIRRFEKTSDSYEAKILINGKVIKNESKENPQGEDGNINLGFNAEDYENKITQINFEIKLINSGDFYPKIGPGWFPIKDRESNYKVEFEITYNVAEEIEDYGAISYN